MPARRYSPGRKKKSERSALDIASELIGSSPARLSYREASLRLHGPVCAKCGREFTGRDLKFLTVHHKDGNPSNNPPDGSNWENLCVECHHDEHSRGLLADYLSGREE